MPRIFKTESRYIRSNFLCFQQAQQLQQARLAQSVARETLNLKVVGSSPTSGFSFLQCIRTWYGHEGPWWESESFIT
jgi:hypothetical protein